MIRTVNANGKIIEYDLEIKRVKNINLRIHYDGKICVSANRLTSLKTVDAFVISKAVLIARALEKYEKCNEISQVKHYTEEELRVLITELCQKVYPYFEKRGVKYPQIKFRRMVSRWGSCHPIKGILTFNTNLVFAPYKCIEYVVLHEFAHFLQPNHSNKFYDELSKVMPDWKMHRQKLKNISIREN